MKKSEALDHWKTLEPNQSILPYMTPIPYKASGSKYGTCGIRIDGNPEFVDAVLSRLKDLLDGENQVTRLVLSRATVEAREINGEKKTYDNADYGAEVCYVRLQMRGSEAGMTMAFTGQNRAETERFAAAYDQRPSPSRR